MFGLLGLCLSLALVYLLLIFFVGLFGCECCLDWCWLVICGELSFIVVWLFHLLLVGLLVSLLLGLWVIRWFLFGIAVVWIDLRCLWFMLVFCWVGGVVV